MTVRSTAVIVVMGVSGSGKSTVGPLLAAHLGCRFLEGDDLHSLASIAKMRAGVPLDDDDRWPWLDRVGMAAGAAARRDGRVVIACSALTRTYRDRIRDRTGCDVLFVVLDADATELHRRMTPRRDHYMPAALLRSQQALLEVLGEEEWARRFAMSADPDDVVPAISAWVEQTLGRPASSTE